MDGKVSGRTLRQEFEARVLAGLFSRLENRCVRYAILRNYECLPHSVGARDIDIVVMPEDLQAATEVVCVVAKEMNLRFASYYRDERLTQFMLFQRAETGEVFDLKIDFFTNSQIYGVEASSAAQMLQALRRHNGLPVVHEKYVFLDKWLFHLLVGKPVHPKYDADFFAICQREKNSLTAVLTPLLGKDLANGMIDGVASGAASKMPPLLLGEKIRVLARMLGRQGLRGIGHFAQFLAYRLRNFGRPPGIFLSVSGPDGSGKTTVIDAVIAELQTIYGGDSVIYRHFRPSVLPRIADVAKAARAIETVDKDYANPHRARPSGPAGSLARLGYYYLDYLVGYFRSVRPVLLKRQIILFDRYYYDMIGDPGRSRIRLPYGLLRFVGHLLPLPSYAFFIHVNPEEIYRRKQELSLEQIKELNSRYLDLVRRGVLLRVDNDGPPQQAIAYIVDKIVADRDAKSRRLLGKIAA